MAKLRMLGRCCLDEPLIMFKRPKIVSPGPQPDPADVENRRNSERKKRLLSGGRGSTLLAMAMERANTAPSATLTGTNG